MPVRRAAVRVVAVCGVRLMFPNWSCVAANDKALPWLTLMMDFDVDEAESNLARMAD